MAKPTAWMPMYWGDYLRDTGHLTTEQHGAYLLLIAHYWSTGKALPDNAKFLQKISKLSDYKAKKFLPNILAFFRLENGLWHHARIERELIAAFDRKDHAKRGAAARWRHEAGDAPSKNRAWLGHCSSNASHNHIKNHESVTTTSTDAARDPALNGGSGPRASRPETSNERLLRLAMESRLKLLKGEA